MSSWAVRLIRSILPLDSACNAMQCNAIKCVGGGGYGGGGGGFDEDDDEDLVSVVWCSEHDDALGGGGGGGEAWLFYCILLRLLCRLAQSWLLLCFVQRFSFTVPTLFALYI